MQDNLRLDHDKKKNKKETSQRVLRVAKLSKQNYIGRIIFWFILRAKSTDFSFLWFNVFFSDDFGDHIVSHSVHCSSAKETKIRFLLNILSSSFFLFFFNISVRFSRENFFLCYVSVHDYISNKIVLKIKHLTSYLPH